MAERRRGEARGAILEAARTAFSTDGYAATGVKDIAAEAGVSVTLIYRYFGSKAGLFEETIIAPAREFVAGFHVDWQAPPAGTDRAEILGDFVERLFGFVSQHSGLFAAWAAAGRTSPSEVLADGSHGRGMRSIATLLLLDRSESDDLDETEVLVACASAMVLSLVVMEDVLLPPGSPLRNRDILIGAVVRYARAASGVRLLEAGPPAPT